MHASVPYNFAPTQVLGVFVGCDTRYSAAMSIIPVYTSVMTVRNWTALIVSKWKHLLIILETCEVSWLIPLTCEYPSSVPLALTVTYVPTNPNRREIAQNQTKFRRLYRYSS
jgi:hypothetical protein